MKARLLATLLAFASIAGASEIELDRAAKSMSDQQAAFTHRFTARGFKSSQVESGTVRFGPLPMMRWTYTSPEQKVFVFDGSTSWFYVPEDRQVTVSRVTDERRRELPFLLLGDASARERHFVVTERRRGRAIVTTLEARDSMAAVRRVSVTIEPATHLIQRIEYSDRDGNQTSFEFSGYHRQPASPDSFRFSPPAGVQVINTD